MPVGSAETDSRPVRAISMKIAHVFLVAVMLTIIKSIQGLPVFELMFFRAFFGLLPLVAFLAWQGKLTTALQTQKPFGHFVRTVLSTGTTGLTFFAVRSMPLPDAVTLGYTAPLFVVALSALLLGEKVRAFRWAAVFVGFIGALIIMWPRLTLLRGGVSLSSHAELLGAGAALLAAASFALNVLMVRKLVATESSSTISLWLGIYSSALLALTVPLGWEMPTLGQFGLLVMAGALGTVVLIVLSESLRAAPASVSAPFEYSSLVFASGLGFVFFNELPDHNTLLGSGFLIAAGLAILWRERAKGRSQKAARATVERSE